MNSTNQPHQRYSIKDFLPLISIVLIIIALTMGKHMVTDSWSAHTCMTNFMGFFFLVFGIFKIINLKNFASAYAMYDLIASKSRIYSLMYPFIELALGLLYLTDLFPLFTHVCTMILMLISAAGVGYALYRGDHLVCACLGTVFKIPMTYVTLLEDLLMAFMAFLMLIF